MGLVVSGDHADKGITVAVFPIVVGTVEALDQPLWLEIQVQSTEGALCLEHEVMDKDTFPIFILEMIDAVSFHLLRS